MTLYIDCFVGSDPMLLNVEKSVIQRGDTCKVSALYKDNNGNGLSGRTVYFFKNNSYIGYGVTNDYGRAKLEFNGSGSEIDGYVGQGNGRIGIMAANSNPVTSGSVVSETYEVLDAKKIYSGTSSKSNLSETPNSDGSYSWSTDGTNAGIFIYSNTQYSSGAIYASIGEHFSFDIVEYTGDIVVRSNISGGSNRQILTDDSTEFANGNHIEIEIIDNGVKINCNGTSRTVALADTGARSLQIRLEPNATLKIKNIAYY